MGETSDVRGHDAARSDPSLQLRHLYAIIAVAFVFAFVLVATWVGIFAVGDHLVSEPACAELAVAAHIHRLLWWISSRC
jgi:hypothetical protein